MSSYGRYGRPALKNSVDVQLQTAFSDGNWNTVIRLATKRAATLKDPYYEVCNFKLVSFFEYIFVMTYPPRANICPPGRRLTLILGYQDGR